MSDNIKILKNYLIYFLVMILVCMIGISGVFADTTYDMYSWTNVAGRNYSVSGLEYTTISSYDNSWIKNPYNFSGGIYTPPNTWDYITFHFFEKNNGVFDPCSGEDFSAKFKLKYSNASLLSYVKEVTFSGTTCQMVKDNSTGIIDVNCTKTPSTGNYNEIFVEYYDYSGNSSSDLYISRNMTVSCGFNTGALIQNNNENTQNIINNGNQNTQDIINNNNTNTDNIINNQNQNTQQQIESQKVCKNIIVDNTSIKYTNVYLNSNGQFSSSETHGVTDFIELNNNSIIDFINVYPYQGRYMCFYDLNKEIISCIQEYNLSGPYNFPTNSKYVRFSIYLSNNVPTVLVDACENGNQALNDSITGLNDSLNDDDSSGATSEASDFFSSFTTNTFGLTSIITAPLNLIQSLTSSTCSELHLPLPYLNNKYLDLPCMTSIYQTYFGSFFTMYQTITYGIIAYWVCVRIFNQVKDFKNPEHDEIEVVDL